MKRRTARREEPAGVHEMRPEYDFGGGVRGKHAARYAAGTNIVVLDPDVARVFSSSEAVNDVLRALLPVIRRRRRSSAGRKRRA